jgi:ABC-type glycerol-3-phosphate transport system substrate-binding protein
MRKLTFIVLFLALFLCVGVGIIIHAGTEEEPEKVTISIAGWGPGEETFKPSWAMFKEAFEAAHPNIILQLVGIPYENLRQQLIVQAQSGTAPDLAQIDSAIDLELAALGFLQPLDDLLTREVKDQIIGALLEASKYKGKIYAVPQSPVPYVLYCSTYLGGKAGVRKRPQTIDELTKQATAIAGLGTDDRGNRIWGFSPDTARWIVGAYDFLPFFYNFGADEFDAGGKVSINSARAVEALSWYRQLTNAGVLGPPGSDVREMRNLFSKDQLGFYVDNPGGRGIIRDQSGMGVDFDSHYEITVFPQKHRPENWSIYYAHTFVMFKQTKHPDAAAQFLNFYVMNSEIQKKYYNDTGQLPPTNAALTDPAYDDPFSKTVMAQAGNVKRPFGLRPDKHGELVDILAVAVQEVVVGGADPKAALDSAAAQMRDLLGE